MRRPSVAQLEALVVHMVHKPHKGLPNQAMKGDTNG